MPQESVRYVAPGLARRPVPPKKYISKGCTPHALRPCLRYVPSKETEGGWGTEGERDRLSGRVWRSPAEKWMMAREEALAAAIKGTLSCNIFVRGADSGPVPGPEKPGMLCRPALDSEEYRRICK